jgi:bacterioferritin-associated ferredoxin
MTVRRILVYIGRYACTCMKVKLKDIEEEIRNGALTFKDIHLKTLCGAKCGVCIDTIKEIVQNSVDRKSKLEDRLNKLKEHLQEVLEERMFVLSQTGLHVPGRTVREYEVEINNLKKEIEEIENIL